MIAPISTGINQSVRGRPLVQSLQAFVRNLLSMERGMVPPPYRGAQA